MTAVLPNSTVLAGAAHGVSRWMRGWSKMGARHVVAWLFATSLMSVVDWTALIDKLDKPNVYFLMAFDFVTSLILFGVTLLAWVAATEGAPISGHERNTRVAWATTIAAVASACLVVPLMRALEVDRMWWEIMSKSKPQPALALVIIGNSIHFVAWSGLFIAAAEVIRRRSLTNEAIRASQREQATLTRDVLESRLAAMQAQVEPQFLFDTLVDIEKLYQKYGAGAAEQLDRLITYLRVALPRLREAGSTMSAEIDLVRAYLDVVRSARGGSPSITMSIDDDCREARFYPMLLLPLVQRAVHSRNAAVPATIRIAVQRTGGDIAVVLRIAAPGGCAEDREIARVRERLNGLYGSRASLDCVELHGDTTQLTMHIPGAAPEAAA
jgi:hypothetical protein